MHGRLDAQHFPLLSHSGRILFQGEKNMMFGVKSISPICKKKPKKLHNSKYTGIGQQKQLSFCNSVHTNNYESFF